MGQDTGTITKQPRKHSSQAAGSELGTASGWTRMAVCGLKIGLRYVRLNDIFPPPLPFLRATNSLYKKKWFAWTQDTLKISGLQVSPAEIEDVLLAEPTGLVKDVAVAGVLLPGARTSDEMSPRAWIVLSAQGCQLRDEEVRDKLEQWVKTNLSKYKWLRGGIQFVSEVRKHIDLEQVCLHCRNTDFVWQIPKNPTGGPYRISLRCALIHCLGVRLGKILRRVLQEQYASESARAKL